MPVYCKLSWLNDTIQPTSTTNQTMDGYLFFEGVYVYYVTFTVVDWLPIFITPEPINIIVDSLRFCIKEKFLRVHAYVIMPNHIHMVVFDAKYDIHQ